MRCQGADLRAENAPKRLDDDVPVDPLEKKKWFGVFMISHDFPSFRLGTRDLQHASKMF
jgi:hypothetical protein